MLRLCGLRCRERCSEPPGLSSSSLEFWGFFDAKTIALMVWSG